MFSIPLLLAVIRLQGDSVRSAFMFMHLGRPFTATEKSLQRVFRSLFRGVLRGLSSVDVLFEMVVYALADAFLIIIFLIRLVASFRAFLRTVALTEKGRQTFVALFRRHTALFKRAFQDVSPEELQQLEGVLKKIGKRAESLAEKKTSSQFG